MPTQPSPAFAPPYVAVIFTSLMHSPSPSDPAQSAAPPYAIMAEEMVALAAQQDGYLGIDSARDPATGLGITISYWRDEAAVAAWKSNAEHLIAQHHGRRTYYEAFTTHIARVERAYSFTRAPQ